MLTATCFYVRMNNLLVRQHMTAINDEPMRMAPMSKKTVSFQVWGDFRLPRCGICATFARSSGTGSELHSQAIQEDAKCVGFEDVTTPHSVRLKHVSRGADNTLPGDQIAHTATPGGTKATPTPGKTLPTPTTPGAGSSVGTRVPASNVSPDTESSVAGETRDQHSRTPMPSSSPSSSLSLLSSISPSPVSASRTPAAPLSSPKASFLSPSPRTNPLSLNADADSAASSPVWWRPSSFYVVLPVMALAALTLILVVFVIRRRRVARGTDNDASTASSKRRNRAAPRYSRVVNDEVTPSPREAGGSAEREEFGARDSDSDGDNEDGNDDLELVVRRGSSNRHSLGLPAGSPLRPTRSLASPRRPVSPSSAKQAKHSSAAHPDVIV